MTETTMLRRGTAWIEAIIGADAAILDDDGNAKINSVLQEIPHNGNSGQSIAEGSKRLSRFIAR